MHDLIAFIQSNAALVVANPAAFASFAYYLDAADLPSGAIS
ncbi:hypothetical protein [Mesorhizobium sp. ES1-4]|nr:hypothetical protein [Mesorhizobium sp. ES1-4]